MNDGGRALHFHPASDIRTIRPYNPSLWVKGWLIREASRGFGVELTKDANAPETLVASFLPASAVGAASKPQANKALSSQRTPKRHD